MSSTGYGEATFNLDGIDIDSSSHVTIHNCAITTLDDGVAVKSGLDAAGRAVNASSHDVTVYDNDFYKGYGEHGD